VELLFKKRKESHYSPIINYRKFPDLLKKGQVSHHSPDNKKSPDLVKNHRLWQHWLQLADLNSKDLWSSKFSSLRVELENLERKKSDVGHELQMDRAF
jgi:hypothetical protein